MTEPVVEEIHYLMQFLGSKLCRKFRFAKELIWDVKQNKFLPPICINRVDYQEFRIQGSNFDTDWAMTVKSNNTFHIPYDDEHLYLIESRDETHRKYGESEKKTYAKLKVNIALARQTLEDEKYIKIYNSLKAIQYVDKDDQDISFLSFAGASMRVALAGWVKRADNKATDYLWCDLQTTGSDKLVAVIHEKIVRCKKLIYILDENFFKSNWCVVELRFGLEKRLNKKLYLLNMMHYDDLCDLLTRFGLSDIIDMAFTKVSQSDVLDKISECVFDTT